MHTRTEKQRQEQTAPSAEHAGLKNPLQSGQKPRGHGSTASERTTPLILTKRPLKHTNLKIKCSLCTDSPAFTPNADMVKIVAAMAAEPGKLLEPHAAKTIHNINIDTCSAEKQEMR